MGFVDLGCPIYRVQFTQDNTINIIPKVKPTFRRISTIKMLSTMGQTKDKREREKEKERKRDGVSEICGERRGHWRTSLPLPSVRQFYAGLAYELRSKLLRIEIRTS